MAPLGSPPGGCLAVRSHRERRRYRCGQHAGVNWVTVLLTRFRAGSTLDPVLIGVLGPLEVGGQASLSPRDRVVVEALVVHSGRSVAADQLADALWGPTPPATWAKVVQGSIMRLRRVLGPAVIETTSDGYRLAVDGDDVDARTFEHLVGRARALSDLGDHERAATTLERAMTLWRGRAFCDVDGWAPAQAEAARSGGDASRRRGGAAGGPHPVR